MENYENFCKINLYDKKGNLKNETIVDKDIYSLLINYAIYYKNGYAIIKLNRKTIHLHKYIYYNLHKRKEIEGMVLDHINNDKLDNRLENIRNATLLQNRLNCLKCKNATSQYYGVYKSKNKWIVKFNNERFSYNNELHAAYHYDLLAKNDINCAYRKLNNIDKPVDFIIKTHRIWNKELPKGIFYENKKYFYLIKKEKFYCSSLEETIRERDKKRKEIKDYNKNLLLNEPIKRNDEGIAIKEIINKRKEIVGFILIDDDVYDKLRLYTISLAAGVPTFWYNKKTTKISKYVMNYDKNLLVDHINGNPLDNRRKNLRIVTVLENSQNKRSATNSSSQYIGVSKDKNKWRAKIEYNGKSEHLGSFLTEIEAAIKRDHRAKELNVLGCKYRLNFNNDN